MLDSWESILALVVAVLVSYTVILWLGTIVWVHRDIRDRTRDGWSQAVSVLLVVLFNLPGLVLYLVLRPRETLMEAYERRLEAEALMSDLPERRVCPGCQRPARPEFLLCPFCRTGLRQACSSCARPLELSWVACPFCGAPGPQQVVAARQAPDLATAPPSPMAPAAPAPAGGPTTPAAASRQSSPAPRSSRP
jgi:hypothetical protein